MTTRVNRAPSYHACCQHLHAIRRSTFTTDVLEATAEQYEKMKFTFMLNGKGEVDRVLVPLQSGVGDIVFTHRKTEPPKPAEP